MIRPGVTGASMGGEETPAQQQLQRETAVGARVVPGGGFSFGGGGFGLNVNMFGGAYAPGNITSSACLGGGVGLPTVQHKVKRKVNSIKIIDPVTGEDIETLLLKSKEDRGVTLNSSTGTRASNLQIIDPVTGEDVVTALLNSKEDRGATLDSSTGAVASNLQEFEAAIRIILNKLTCHNCEEVARQMLKLQIDTLEKLKVVMNLVYAKAIEDTTLSVACAKLCSYLNQITVKGSDSCNNFKKCLLKYCQNEFEKDKSAELQNLEKLKEIENESVDIKKLELRLQLEDDEWQKSRESLGLTRFIGELFNVGMINHTVAMICIQQLLESGDEESLKCLSLLVTTVGRDLEMKIPMQKTTLDKYFTKMEAIVNKEETPSDIRCMLLNAVELRKNNWIPKEKSAVERVSQASGVKFNDHKDASEPDGKAAKFLQEPGKEIEDLNMETMKLLNRLTPQNFEDIAKQLLKLPVNTIDKLKEVINLICEKGVNEPEFSAACAGLCKHLYQADFGKEIQKDATSRSSFRMHLLKLCQSEFEKDRAAEYGVEEKLNEIVKETVEEKRKILRLQLVENLSLLRTKSVGVSRFIGELYLVGMLTHSIVIRCINCLLESADEEDLECLCVLMTVIGKALEEKTVESGKPGLKGFYSKMEDIMNKRKTSAEVRLMLKEVLDLEKNNWISIRVQSDPKKKDLMNLEAEMESFAQRQLTSFNMSVSSSGTINNGMKAKEDQVEAAAEKVTKEEEPSAIVYDSNKNSEECTKLEKDLLSVQKLEEDEKITAAKNSEDKTASASNFIASSHCIQKNIYEEGQWSPFNPQGERKYGRDFLFALQNYPLSLRRPEFTLDVDCILPYGPNRVDLPRSSQQDWIPCFVKVVSEKSKPRKRSQCKSMEKKDKALQPNEEPMDEISIQLLETTKEILSHLTTNNNEEVALKIMKLQINTIDHLRAVINPLFEKAVDARYISETYAGLCYYLNNANFGWQALKDEDSSDNFKKVLMECFAREFKKNEPNASGLAWMLRSLGVTSFLGELYKLGMITDSILDKCIKNLLKSGDDSSLEHLIKLMSERKKV